MSDSNPLINIGDLAKPVEALVQRSADFIGAIAAPYQLKRMAKAKVEADRIEKLGSAETEFQERALQRLFNEEMRNQENIENILHKALPEVKEDAKPEEISDDWLALFFEKSKRFSDEEMQNLWAKILAGEANEQGSFSKRTIETVSSLERDDAEIFTNLQSFVWHIEDAVPFVYANDIQIYENQKITFDNLNHLETIGLIKFNPTFSFRRHGVFSQGIVKYFDTEIYIKLPNDFENEFGLGQVLFTKVGLELAGICKSRKSDSFLKYILERWQFLGYEVSKLSQEQQILTSNRFLFSS